jgi:hypothetical protein
MELTENKVEELQIKVAEATSDAFRKTILDFVKDYNRTQRCWDRGHEDIHLKVCENTLDRLFSQACKDIIDQVLPQPIDLQEAWNNRLQK